MENYTSQLFVFTKEEQLENETVRLLAQTLTEKESFTDAKFPMENGFLAVGVLRLKDLDIQTIQKAAQEAAQWAKNQISVNVDLNPFCEVDSPRLVHALTLAFSAAGYRFDYFKKDANPVALQNLTFSHEKHLEAVQKALEESDALSYGINLCKDLGNTAPNICTPTYLAQIAVQEAEKYGVNAQVFGSDFIRENMGSFWSVAKGSVQEPYLIELSYQGAENAEEQPIVLVGKGITFDTGGISLKPAAEMDEMKYDMGGAASVLGTFFAAVKAKLPINLVAIVPTCENMPDAAASKPGDIVRAMNGTTIEILNTDAEGRLILCDALTYAERFNPKAVIDVATLTGACVIALGHVASGMTANNQDLADQLLTASRESNDKTWQLPLFDEYKEQLKSNFADLQNIGGRAAGTLTAATFLAHFTQNYAWAHLDIAGIAWKSGKDKGATGRPVPLLFRFLQNQAQNAQEASS